MHCCPERGGGVAMAAENGNSEHGPSRQRRERARKRKGALHGRRQEGFKKQKAADAAFRKGE